MARPQRHQNFQETHSLSSMQNGVQTMLSSLSHGAEYRTHKSNFYKHFSPRFSLLEPFDGGMAGSGGGGGMRAGGSSGGSPGGMGVGTSAGVNPAAGTAGRPAGPTSAVPTIDSAVSSEMEKIQQDQAQFYRLLSQYATAKKTLLSDINTSLNAESNQYKGKLIREPSTDTTFYVSRFGVVRPFTAGSVSNMDATCSNLGMSPDISGSVQDFVKQHDFSIGNAMASGEPCGIEGQNVQAFTATYSFNAGGGKPDICADTPANSNMVLTGQSCGMNADGSVNMLWSSLTVQSPAQRCAQPASSSSSSS